MVFTRKNRFLPSGVSQAQQLACAAAMRMRSGAECAMPSAFDRRPRAGDAAPDFDAVSTGGRRIRLGDFRGRKLVLYFYPRDDTPGCTRQACSLRDGMQAIAGRGAAVVGVSTQGEASHRAFSDRHRLNFPLLADADGRIGRAYGVLGGAGLLARLRTMAGLAQRVTFVIDEEGRVAHVIERPDVSRHAAEVLRLL